MKIKFNADRVKISGPRVDESFLVSFETGEYEKSKLAELFLVPSETMLKVTVETED
jgi:hypothetical protein